MRKQSTATHITIAGIVFSSLFLIFLPLSHAQVPGVQQRLSVNQSPENPRANSEVTFRVSSTFLDINRATISWVINGVQRESGIGKKEVRVTTGALGSVTTVFISAAEGSGAPITKTITLAPAEVDLLWESSAYTPPFYKGKAPAVRDGSVKFVAMPHLFTRSGRKLASKDLVYTWELNYKIMGHSSGTGRNTFTPENIISYTRGSGTVSVTVAAPDGSLKAHSALVVRPSQPVVRFYRDDPVLGVLYNRALRDTLPLRQEEVVLVASPYFFSPTVRESGDFDYAWKINGRTISSLGSNTSSLRLRQEGEGESGASAISLVVRNVKALFQEARNSLRIEFGDSL